MTKGFFSESELIEEAPTSLIPKCGLCKMCEPKVMEKIKGVRGKVEKDGPLSPKMPYAGKGRKKILLVAEAPGVDEDKSNTQYIGTASQLLAKLLHKAGLDMRRDCWMTNAIICRPYLNRKPTVNEIQYCRPNLLKTINELEPRVVILMGAVPVQSLLGHLFKEKPGAISKWNGMMIPSQETNTWIVPAYHPSYLMRVKNDLLDREFIKIIKRAAAKKIRPWHEQRFPDYEDKVDVVLDTKKAARILRQMITKGGCVSWDIETNMIKPDGNKANIHCASVCWMREKTIAFPWQGEVIPAMSELLKSKLWKIGANMKFEDRWIRALLKHGIRNWLWDTVLASHLIDNRKGGICSVKFQAFTSFGFPLYNKHIEPFLKSKSKIIPNKIHQVELNQLLRYCGIDSLLEYDIGLHQMRKLKFERKIEHATTR